MCLGVGRKSKTRGNVREQETLTSLDRIGGSAISHPRRPRTTDKKKESLELYFSVLPGHRHEK